MIAVINFQMIGQINQYSFELPYQSFISNLNTKCLFLDADQYSDGVLVGQIQEAANEATKVLMILSGDENAELKNLLWIGEWVLSNKDKVFVLDLVQNSFTIRWSKLLNEHYCADKAEELKESFIKNALQAQE
jgi:hypothetical protein